MPTMTTGKKLPPGPRGIGLNRLVHRLRDHAGFFQHYHDQYGDIVYFSMVFNNMCLVYNPHIIEEVLITKRHAFEKGPLYQRNRILVNPTTMTTVGPQHRRLRKLVQPSFRLKAIKGYAEIMIDEAVKLRDRWEDGADIDVNPPMHQLTLDIVARAFFGRDSKVDSMLLKGVLTALSWSAVLTFIPLGNLIGDLPIPKNRNARRAIENLDKVVYSVIEKARNSEEEREDLVSFLINAKDEEGIDPALTNEEVRDESYVMLIAGHETSANTLVWCFYYLSRYPEARARLEKEVDEVLGGRRPTTEDLDHLIYTGAVLDEVLRISPPSILVGRRCIEDCELGGYHIPKGTIVQPYIRAPHRNEKYWPQATEFRPERWFEPDLPKRPTHAYLPFGAGESKCAGVAFARTEVILTLAIITQRWRVETKSEEFPEVDSLAGFYRVRRGLPCTVHRRK